MKTTFRTIAAMSAAVLALVSCSKENIPGGKENTQTAKERVYTLSFNTTGTKTALSADGKTPEFQNGDWIKVFDGSNSIELPVSVSKGQATVTVPGSISGDFRAVYPASAYQEAEPYFKVENIQDGTFAKANICLAEVPSGATKMTFTNQTVIFSFDVTSYEGTYIHVIAARDDISNTVVTGNTKLNRVVVPAEDVAAIKASDNKTCYVSVYVPKSATLTCHDISFANGSKIKVPAKAGSPTLAINNIFPVDMTSGWTEPYVEIEMTVNSVKDTYKWATRNIGAETSTDYGEYFAWGETTGHEANDAKTAFKDGHSFTWETTPFNGGKSTYSETEFNKVKDAVCPNGILALPYDSANANWGGSWRLPTKEEFDAFLDGTDEYDSESDANFSHRGVTFPASGYALGTGINCAGEGGYYLSLTLHNTYFYSIYIFKFGDFWVETTTEYRNNGMSVRPFSD